VQWNQIVGNVKNVTVPEAAAFLEQRPLGTYEILDVRQPAEYKEGHIAGARLLPLPELLKGNVSLSAHKSYLVYCRAGSRSLAACQWLASQGITEVKNLVGGYLVWSGLRAKGPYEQHLTLLEPEAEFEDALSLAFAMEDGLGRLYHKLSLRVPNPICAKLLSHLVEFEERHKAALAASSTRPQGPKFNPKHGQLVESGAQVSAVCKEMELFLNLPEDVFDFAMGIEAQAFDLYMRLSQTALSPATEKLFLDLAEEECTHLDLLKIEADRYFRQHSS